MPVEYDVLGNPINGNWNKPTITEQAMQIIAQENAAKQARADAAAKANSASASRVQFDPYEDESSPLYGQEPPAGSEGAPGTNILNKYRSFNYNFTLSAITAEQFNKPDSYNTSIESLKYVVLSSKGKPSPTTNNVVQASENAAVGAPITPAIIEMQKVENVLRQNLAAAEKNGQSTTAFEAALNENIIKRSQAQSALLSSGNTTEPIDTSAVIADYNNISPGRFDMFIDDIQIDAVIANNEQTTTSLAYEIKFSVIEPYSVFGFLEALQASAKAAGYDNYRIANFVLAVDFAGYPDSSDMPNPVPVIDTATNKPAIRFFALTFYEIKASVTDRGTVYTCMALPAADKAFSNTSDGTIGTPTAPEGKTVKEKLKSLMDSFNAEAQKRAERAGSSVVDIYAVEFPDFTETGLPLGGDNSIASAVFETLDGGMKDISKNKQSGNEANTSVSHFDPNASNKSKIEAIIVSSTYVTDLVKASSGNGDIDKKVDAANQAQMFRVVPRKEDHPEMGIDPLTLRPAVKWIYQIIKTKTSYHRVPGQARNVPSLHKLKKLALRRYDYIYTGLNTNILDFKIDFNLAFFEGVSPGLGADGQPKSRNNDSTNNETAPSMKPGAAGNTTSPGGAPPAPMLSTSGTSSSRPYNQVTGSAPTPGSPWTQQSRLMYQGIMGAPDAFVTGELTILGDPYFLVTGGVGNYIPESNIQGKYAGNGEASVLAGDVLIQLNFYNPIDIGLDGFLKMDSKPVGFSGIFQIIKVTNQFKNGEFKQILQYVRIPTPDEPTPVSSKVGLTSKPIKEDVKGTDSSPAQVHPSLASDGVINSPTATANKPPQPPADKTAVYQGFTAGGNPISQATIDLSNLAAGLKNPFAPLQAAVTDLQATANNAVLSVENQVTGAVRSAQSQVTGAIASGVSAVTSPLSNIIKRG